MEMGVSLGLPGPTEEPLHNHLTKMYLDLPRQVCQDCQNYMSVQYIPILQLFWVHWKTGEEAKEAKHQSLLLFALHCFEVPRMLRPRNVA